jgi:hypothetical protein
MQFVCGRLCNGILNVLARKPHCKSPLLRPLQQPWNYRDLCREGRSNAIPSQIHYILFLAAACTKSATLDGSKFNHLHLSGWFHVIFRIPFITSVYSEMGSQRQRAEKWREMNLRGRARKDTVSLTPKIPSVFLTNFYSFWPTWRNPFIYQKKYENLRKQM